MSERLLVVSAHIGDWLWRCSGTIAKYLRAEAEVKVICLTAGVRSESDAMWKKAGTDTAAEEIKRRRCEEASAAAESLGVQMLEIWDYEDCPLVINDVILARLSREIREYRPTLIITHDSHDKTNLDHPVANEIVSRALLMSRQIGIQIDDLEPAKNVQVYGMEPAQPELSGFVPDIYMDITDVFDEKRKAMECIKSQPRNPSRHTYATALRGRQARTFPKGSGAEYAECFSIRFPIVVKDLLL